jgi:hypothetical protein
VEGVEAAFVPLTVEPDPCTSEPLAQQGSDTIGDVVLPKCSGRAGGSPSAGTTRDGVIVFQSAAADGGNKTVDFRCSHEQQR